jgi:hypothetical protein
MTYQCDRPEGRWRIDALKFDQLSRWQLYRAVNDAWLRVQVFATAEDAMAAVGQGLTGVAAWDALPHDATEFEAKKWSFERY